MSTCNIEGCTRPAKQLGMCIGHYGRKRRGASLELPLWPSKKATLEERLVFHSAPEPNTGCWLWMGSTAGAGYGVIGVNGKNEYCHRVAFELFKGPIPEGLTIDHLCRVRVCCNPDHLEAVTHKENCHRSPHSNIHKTHCPRGHPYSEDNTYVRNGKRQCKACWKIKNKERWARRGSVL